LPISISEASLLVSGGAVTLAVVHGQLVWLTLVGAIVPGGGFGVALSGSMETVTAGTQ
jgi:hypothetical protein